jgi:hypothetical protein
MLNITDKNTPAKSVRERLCNQHRSCARNWLTFFSLAHGGGGIQSRLLGQFSLRPAKQAAVAQDCHVRSLLCLYLPWHEEVSSV